MSLKVVTRFLLSNLEKFPQQVVWSSTIQLIPERSSLCKIPKGSYENWHVYKMLVFKSIIPVLKLVFLFSANFYNARMDSERPALAALAPNTSPQNNFFKCPKKI